MQEEKKITAEEKAILAAYEEAVEDASEETTEEAFTLVKILYGDSIPRHAPITMLMVGFLIGIDKGMKLEAEAKKLEAELEGRA